MHQSNHSNERSSSFLSYSLTNNHNSQLITSTPNNFQPSGGSFDGQSQSSFRTSQSSQNEQQQLPPMSSFTTNGQFVASQSLLPNHNPNFNEFLPTPTPEEPLENTQFEMDTQSLDMVDMFTSSYDFDANSYLPDSQPMMNQVLVENQDHYYGTAAISSSDSQASQLNHQELSFPNSLPPPMTLPLGHSQSVGEILASMDFPDTETFLTDQYCADQNQIQQQQPTLTANPISIGPQLSTIQMPASFPINALTTNNSQIISKVVQITTVQTTQSINSQQRENLQFNQNASQPLGNAQLGTVCVSNESQQKQTEESGLTIIHNPSISIQASEVPVYTVNISDLIEELKCFKCKLCDFINLKKEAVNIHINEKHKAESNQMNAKVNDKIIIENSKNSNSYFCCKCYHGFTTLQACRQHMISQHNFKVDQVTLVSASRNINELNDKNKMTTKSCSKEIATENNLTMNSQKSKQTAKLRHILPISIQPVATGAKKNKQITAKSHHNHLNNSGIHKTSKKMAWRKKMKREQGAYICEFKGCSVRFRALENLQYHHKCHSDNGSGFACCNCQRTSEHWASMAGHLWRSHNIDLELHACEHCNYRTYSLSVLENIHKRIHGNEKNYLCDTCGKGFKNCKQLINHKVKHNTSKSEIVKAHECDICTRQFTDARSMRVHQNTVHNKTRPYICSDCSHSAASRSALRIHMRQHTGEKPFKCDLCSYSTSDHNSLRRHKMRHSGERPYKCPFCSYACIQSSTYKQHLKNKHPGQNEGLMFTCQFCGFKTVNQDMYHTHISEHNRNHLSNQQEINMNIEHIEEERIQVSAAIIYNSKT